jgi:hypothetical protein
MMIPHPTKIKSLILLIFVVFFQLSCEKDSDLFAELIDEEIATNIIEDSINEKEDTTKNDSIITAISKFPPINDAFIQGTQSYNESIIRLEGGKRISYMMFDIKDVSDITNVSLEFTIDQDSGNGIIEVYKGSDNNWTESNLTPENAPKAISLIGTIEKSFPVGETQMINLNPSEIKSGLVSLVLVLKSGNDLAIASKENTTVSIPNLVVSNTPVSGSDNVETSDVDGDGIIDSLDGCPNEVGTVENNGCPISTNQNSDCYDTNYPVMNEFAKAGVTGGIPNNLAVVMNITPKDNLQSAINNVSANGGGVILLSAGTYPITSTLNMKSNVVLRGTEKDNVILESTIRSTKATWSIFFAAGVKYAGLEKLTYRYRVDGCEPRDNLNGSSALSFENIYSNDPCGLTNLNVWGVFFYTNSNNNWIDNCNLLESGSSPIMVFGNHNTVSNSLIDRAYNKGAGGRGYIDIKGNYNLILTNEIHRIRHLDISGGGYPDLAAKYNVFYGNNLTVDVNFHSGDAGYNLVEKNIISPPIYAFGGGIPFETGRSKYGHEPAGNNNYIYNNTTTGAGKPLYTNKSIVYTVVGGYNPGAYVDSGWNIPSCGSFYPKGN